MGVEPFLTAYDPSDLPGGSIDPLGFERGYLFLADKILPGLTNVAGRPRYFAVLCTGTYLAGDLIHESPRIQYRQRLDVLLRFERFWALSNVLSSYENGGADVSLSGLRGVTYAKTKAQDVLNKGNSRINADYKLLSRQLQYGCVGIYGAVADGMRLIDRKILSLTPDLGERIARCFIEETSLSKDIIKAVLENTSVEIATLTAWGEKAHIEAAIGNGESEFLSDALNMNPVRSRMTKLLKKHPFYENETELSRLSRILSNLRLDKDVGLKESIHAILCYEEVYRLMLLSFERVLWLCRQDPTGSVTRNQLNKDPVIQKVKSALPRSMKKLIASLNSGTDDYFRKDIHILTDMCQAINDISIACEQGDAFIDSLLSRHNDVQKGKFDRGKRKMPWAEWIPNDRIALTSTRVGGLNFEATQMDDISAHPYRLLSADALYEAARKR